jgi:predicted nucleotidyltransferase
MSNDERNKEFNENELQQAVQNGDVETVKMYENQYDLFTPNTLIAAQDVDIPEIKRIVGHALQMKDPGF